MKFFLCFFIIVTLNLSAASPKESLNTAKNYFNFGKYEKTIEILKENILKIEDKESKVYAFELLGSSLFFQKKLEASKKEFMELLSMNPKHELDSLVYPPPLIEFFNQTKAEFIKKNKMITQILKEEKKKKEEAKKEIVIKEIHLKETKQIITKIERNPYIFAVMPFGYAQYRNKQTSKAYIFLTGESLLLAGNIISYFITYSLKNDNGYYTGSNKTKAEVYNAITKYTFFAFISLVALGAVDGIINYEPIFEKKVMNIKNKPVKIGFLDGNFLSFKYEF